MKTRLLLAAVLGLALAALTPIPVFDRAAFLIQQAGAIGVAVLGLYWLQQLIETPSLKEDPDLQIVLEDARSMVREAYADSALLILAAQSPHSEYLWREVIRARPSRPLQTALSIRSRPEESAEILPLAN